MNTKHTRLEMEMLSIIEEAEKHSRKRLPVKKATWLKMVDIINRAQTENGQYQKRRGNNDYIKMGSYVMENTGHNRRKRN